MAASFFRASLISVGAIDRAGDISSLEMEGESIGRVAGESRFGPVSKVRPERAGILLTYGSAEMRSEVVSAAAGAILTKNDFKAGVD